MKVVSIIDLHLSLGIGRVFCTRNHCPSVRSSAHSHGKPAPVFLVWPLAGHWTTPSWTLIHQPAGSKRQFLCRFAQPQISMEPRSVVQNYVLDVIAAGVEGLDWVHSKFMWVSFGFRALDFSWIVAFNRVCIIVFWYLGPLSYLNSASKLLHLFLNGPIAKTVQHFKVKIRESKNGLSFFGDLQQF